MISLFNFNLNDLEYKPGTSVIDFYTQYRNLFVARLKKKGDTIHWQNTVLTEDEQLSPTFEELILTNLLCLIDNHLPGYVNAHYQHPIGETKSLMYFKDDILAETPTFLKKIQGSFGGVSKEDVDKNER